MRVYDLLEVLFVPGDVVEVRALSKRGRSSNIGVANRIRHFSYPKDTKALKAFVQNASTRMTEGTWALHGVYISVNPRSELKPDSQGSKARDVKYVGTLFIDLDVFGSSAENIYLSVEGIRVQPTKEWAVRNKDIAKEFLERLAVNIYQRLRDLDMAPVIIADSGFGLHFFFKLNPPIAREEGLPPLEAQRNMEEQYRAAFKVMKTIILGILEDVVDVEGADGKKFLEAVIDDNVADVARVARLPGIPNSKLAYQVQNNELIFDPEALMETRVLFLHTERNELFDHNGLEVDPLDTEWLLKEYTKSRKAKNAGRIRAAGAVSSISNLDEEWKAAAERAGLQDVLLEAREKGLAFVEVEDDDTLKALKKKILRIYPPEGIRHDFFLRFPSFLLLRGLGPQTVMKAFDMALRDAAALGWESEAEVKDRIRTTVDAIVNFIRWRNGEEITPIPAGWRGLFFEDEEGNRLNPRWTPLKERLNSLPEELKKELEIGDIADERGLHRHVTSTIASLAILVKSIVRGASSGAADESDGALKELREKFNPPEAKSIHEEVLYGVAKIFLRKEVDEDAIVPLWEHLYEFYGKMLNPASEQSPLEGIIKLREETSTRPSNTVLVFKFKNGRREAINLDRLKWYLLAIKEGTPVLSDGKNMKKPPVKMFAGLNEAFRIAGKPLFIEREEIIEKLTRAFNEHNQWLFEARYSREVSKIMYGYYAIVYRALESAIARAVAWAEFEVSSSLERAVAQVFEILLRAGLMISKSVTEVSNYDVTLVPEKGKLVIPRQVLLSLFKEAKEVIGNVKFEEVHKALVEVFQAGELYVYGSDFRNKDVAYVVPLKKLMEVGKMFLTNSDGFFNVFESEARLAEEEYRKMKEQAVDRGFKMLLEYGELRFEEVKFSVNDSVTAREVWEAIHTVARRLGHKIVVNGDYMRLALPEEVEEVEVIEVGKVPDSNNADIRGGAE